MKWNIRAKILAGFALALLILLIIGTLANRSIEQLLAATAVRQHTHEVLLNLEDLRTALVDAETGQRGFIIFGKEEYLEPYSAGLKAAAETGQALRRLTRDNAAQQRRLDQLEPIVAAKLADMKRNIELRRTAPFEEVRESMAGAGGKSIMDEIRRVLGAMKDDEKALDAIRAKESDKAAALTRNVIIIGTLLSAVLLGLAGWFIAKNIAQPITAMTAFAEQIAAGDLNVQVVTSDRSDEVGTLGRAFARMSQTLGGMAAMARRVAGGDLTADIRPLSDRDALGQSFRGMTESLRQVMQEITEAVNVLGSSSREILSSTAQLAASAAQTATAVAETTTTVEEIKQTSQLSAQKARFVSDQAQKAAEVSQTGKDAVGATIEGMNGIRQQMGTVAESILSLSAQGQAIGEIITTVDDLAAQSRLLAVNASIEAAKAGEEGRGFSVVAQEVRTLAEQSKQATTQVRGILNDIQKATSSAVLATEQATKTVESGVRQSTDAGDSISTLADSVTDAAQAATQIAATSQEQFVGMDQVALAMDNIKQASTQTVASTREAEAAAQGLHDLGRKLKELVTRFKV